MAHASDSRSRACVAIPFYRTALPPDEQLALRRCLQVLGAHDIVAFHPEGLDMAPIRDGFGVQKFEALPAPLFAGVRGYNRLMLADDFYARFAAYDYLLIYQLDAFVFSDQLLAWCDRGYDYIGAPWLPAPRVPGWRDDLYGNVRRRLARWTARIDPRTQGMHAAQYMYAVGNGGFSLRRVARMRSVLHDMRRKADEYRRAEAGFFSEDMFFAVEANRFWSRLRIPGYREAAGFSWELQPQVGAALNGGQLPFGCHAWNKLHREHWRVVFASFGIALDDVLAPA